MKLTTPRRLVRDRLVVSFFATQPVLTDNSVINDLSLMYLRFILLRPRIRRCALTVAPLPLPPPNVPSLDLCLAIPNFRLIGVPPTSLPLPSPTDAFLPTFCLPRCPRQDFSHRHCHPPTFFFSRLFPTNSSPDNTSRIDANRP